MTYGEMMRNFLTYLILLVIVAFSSVLSGCSGGEGSGSESTISPIPTQKNVTVNTVKNGTVKDPTVVISNTSGEKISYFAPSIGAKPTQAQLIIPSGISLSVFYALDGSIDKVVDNNNGDFLIFHPRTDSLGMEYVLFDKNGNFLDGVALFLNNGTWNTATILGLPARLAGTNYGAAVYGPMTSVNSNLAAFITFADHPVAMNQTLFKMGLDVIIPSAYAFSNKEKKNLKKATDLFLSSAAHGGPLTKLGRDLLGTGMVELFKGLSGQANRGEEVTSAVVDNLLYDTALPVMYEGEDFLETGETTCDRISQGMARPNFSTDNLNYTNPLLTEEQRDISELINPPQSLPDTTPNPKILPATTLSSSMPTPIYPDPIVTSVEPSTATLGQSINIVIRGSNFVGWNSLYVQLDGCPNIGIGSGADSPMTFVCTPTSAGLKKGKVLENGTWLLLKKFSINVIDNTPKETVVSSVTPEPPSPRENNKHPSESLNDLVEMSAKQDKADFALELVMIESCMSKRDIACAQEHIDKANQLASNSSDLDLVYKARQNMPKEKQHAANVPETSAEPMDSSKDEPGTMPLTAPFWGVSKYKFPTSPSVFQMNTTLAKIGMIQGQVQFKSTTIENAYANGPIYITVTEPGSSASSAAIQIRFDSSVGVNHLGGELVPVVGGGMCSLMGTNEQNFPTCASLGITYDKKRGKLIFKNTSLYPLSMNIAPTMIKDLTLNFTPY